MRSLMRLHARRGAAAVEFALTLAPVLILLFGIINCALAAYTYGFVASSAQQAARFAAVHGSLSTSPASADEIARFVDARAAGLKRDHLRVFTHWNPNNLPGGTVRVQVEYRFFFAVPFAPLPPITLTASAARTVLN